LLYAQRAAPEASRLVALSFRIWCGTARRNGFKLLKRRIVNEKF